MLNTDICLAKSCPASQTHVDLAKDPETPATLAKETRCFVQASVRSDIGSIATGRLQSAESRCVLVIGSIDVPRVVLCLRAPTATCFHTRRLQRLTRRLVRAPSSRSCRCGASPSHRAMPLSQQLIGLLASFRAPARWARQTPLPCTLRFGQLASLCCSPLGRTHSPSRKSNRRHITRIACAAAPRLSRAHGCGLGHLWQMHWLYQLTWRRVPPAPPLRPSA